MLRWLAIVAACLLGSCRCGGDDRKRAPATESTERIERQPPPAPGRERSPRDPLRPERIAEFDLDGDGRLSAQERSAMRAKVKADAKAGGHPWLDAEERRALRQRRASRLMMRLDTDRDGTLSRDEVQRIHDRRGPAGSIGNFDAIDTDGDGVLSLEEVEASMMRTLRSDRDMLEDRAVEEDDAADQP
jgi:Ca2+-binding EF-hand superfamily protein